MNAVLNEAIASLVPLVLAVLLALGSLAVKRLADWLQLSSDDKVRAYLQDALLHAIERGVAVVRGSPEHAGRGQEALREAALRVAADYVRDRVPDALARFGVSDGALTEMLQARLLPGEPL